MSVRLSLFPLNSLSFIFAAQQRNKDRPHREAKMKERLFNGNNDKRTLTLARPQRCYVAILSERDSTVVTIVGGRLGCKVLISGSLALHCSDEATATARD